MGWNIWLLDNLKYPLSHSSKGMGCPSSLQLGYLTKNPRNIRNNFRKLWFNIPDSRITNEMVNRVLDFVSHILLSPNLKVKNAAKNKSLAVQSHKNSRLYKSIRYYVQVQY